MFHAGQPRYIPFIPLEGTPSPPAYQFLDTPLHPASATMVVLGPCCHTLSPLFLCFKLQFDLCCWPTIQWINFYYLPPRARVIYVNSVTFLWDMFLSFMVYDYKSESGSEGSISESQQKCA